ncbi:MAG: cobaltochelatase subunit CobN [Ectothiorhodospira sp.]
MHLLAAQPGGFVDDPSVITRMDQDPAEIVLLSAADTTLALLAAECPRARGWGDYPSVRLANLLYLSQPASVDLYLEEVLQHARLILIDHLGGESYWPYGTEQVEALCRRKGIPLVMFSGDHTEDPNLLLKSTVPPEVSRTLWQYLKAGGSANIRAFYRYLGATFFDMPLEVPPPRPLPRVSIFHPDEDTATVSAWQAQWIPGAPRVALPFYRAHLQAGNTRVIEALCRALLERGLNPLPMAVVSLKDTHCLETVRRLCREQGISLVLNATAFSRSAGGDGEPALVDDLPVLQVIFSGGNRDAWEESPHGLQPRDIAMQVALPEMDGALITRAVSFKGRDHRCPHTQSDVVRYRPQAGRIAFVAELARRWCDLRRRPNADKRLGLVLANYPTREGRLGNGVGLDTPASVIAILRRLAAQGYGVEDIPADGEALMDRLRSGVTNDPDRRAVRPAHQSLAMAEYRAFFEGLPEVNRRAVLDRWGAPEDDPMVRRQRFMIPGIRCGRVFVGIQPARGYDLDMMANYHDPDLVPPHAYLAFYLWLRQRFDCDAIVHVGKHGNLEWLPGKSVALGETCWPDLAFGPLPHLYPFIVNDPGEGTQAKRRSQAVIIDHLMPPLTRAENYGPIRDLERQVDEYYEALMLDRRRAGALRRQILASIVDQDLHRDLGLEAPRSEAEEQLLLNRTDAYLCELKESQIRDGLHVFGQSPEGRLERDTLLALARYPSGSGHDGDDSLIRALARDLCLGRDFDPLEADWETPWEGPRPACLVSILEEPWRHQGDTRERLEALARRVLEAGLPRDGTHWHHTRPVLERIERRLRPDLRACGAQELGQLCRGLEGCFVPPGPSGAPSRGRPDVLPTGRNFFSVDARAIPTATSWALGEKSARRMVEKYIQENGDYPRAIGLSVWGTSTMRTGGDDMAQAMALIGVRPRWAAGSHRVTDFEILPLSALGRPRVDVTLRISGLFRDAFAQVIRLFDAAVQAVAGLDEPEDMNPLRARIRRETEELTARGLDAGTARRQAGYRIFGARPEAYGAGIQGLMEAGNWQTDADLALAYVQWGGHAYGQDQDGDQARESLARRLGGLDLVLHNQDNREHDLLDSDDYYQFQGGMTAAVRHFSGRQPRVYFGDHSHPASPRIHTLEQEISRVVRSRVTNPKWIEGVMRHGYKGAAEMAATVDYLFAYDATARVVRDDQYARVTDAYINDPRTRGFILRHNPDALHGMCERLLEAMDRGLWAHPGPYRQQIQGHLIDAEEHLEE